MYAIIAQPSRRRIMDRLLRSDEDVTEIVDALGISQPLVSKHLRTLRESGLVQVKVVAQRRIYSLNPGPLAEVDEWPQLRSDQMEPACGRAEQYLEQKKTMRGDERHDRDRFGT